MRSYFLLILIAVSMAFSAGFLSLRLREVPRAGTESLAHFDRMKAGFVKTHPGAPELDLGKLFPSGDPAQFVDPGFALPQTTRYRRAELAALFRYAQDCKLTRRRAPRSAALRKAWLWEDFACGAIRALPQSFFEAEPYIHPSGHSFAYLAARAPALTPADAGWLAARMHLFHALELSKLGSLADGLPAMRERALLRSMSPAQLKALAEHEPVLLEDRILLRKPAPADGRGANRSYLVYPLKDWRDFIASSSFAVMPSQEGAFCVHREGNLCWTRDVDRIYQAANRPLQALFAGSLLLAALAAYLIVKRIRAQSSSEDRRRFALQTLTHELRTPLSSLVVSVETLRRCFEALPEDSAIASPTHDALIRVSDDVRRLQRLAESSRQYLNAHAQPGALRGKSLIRVDRREVPSLNDFVESVLDPLVELRGAGQVRFERLERDHGAWLDPYWVGICLKNLVENALLHGKPPVTVRLVECGDSLEVQVEDEGSCTTHSLDELTRPFIKGTRSQGIGLGLSIVRRVVEEMQGVLGFVQSPTRFSIRLTSAFAARKPKEAE